MTLLLLLACPKGGLGTNESLETFDAAWSRVAETHYDPQMNGVDWEGVREELRPKAARARTPDELRPVLEDMLSRLGESHYAVFPGSRYSAELLEAEPERQPEGLATLGIELRVMDGHAVVFRGDEEVRPGWILHKVGEVDVDARVAAWKGTHTEEVQDFVVNGLVRGAEGAKVSLSLEDGAGQPQVVERAYTTEGAFITTIGNLPPLLVDLDFDQVDTLGVITFNAFFPQIIQPFGAAIAAARSSQGLVIDLRGNPGGVAAMVSGLAGWLMAEPAVLGTMITRNERLEFKVNPRLAADRFNGPVAVLIDGASASTSELFAAGLKGVGRARVFGSTSAGMALPSVVEELPNGDRLQLVIADLRGPDEARIEGVGVAPDVAAALSRAALLEGRDPALDAAMDWLRGCAGAQPCGDAR